MTDGESKRPTATARGIVSLVGAGPGDPELLTVRALQRLRSADLVLYDGLTPDAVVALAAQADRVSVAKRVGRKALTQQEVSERMIAAALAGRRVVRLKSGDPFVLGRGGEEAQALRAAGVPFEVVPGVTSATAGPAAAGIPVTYRGVASAFVVVSGHERAAYEPVLASISPVTTIVVLMGIGERARIAQCLVAAGWLPETPAAVVVNASRSGEKIWTGSLATLGVKDGIGSRRQPGVLVIGHVVSLATVPDAGDRFR
ncbi:MAG: uroporphyrinogen-III C-methyltransferase [Vicinamibacterales bacterium]